MLASVVRAVCRWMLTLRHVNAELMVQGECVSCPPLNRCGWDGFVSLPSRGSRSGKGTSVLSWVAAVRAADSAGNLGCFPSGPAFQARYGGGGDDEVSRFLLVGLCTAACKLARGFMASAGDALRGVASGPRFRVRVARSRGRATSRGKRTSSSSRSGRRSVCSGSVVGCRSQREASGSEKPLRLRPEGGTGA